MVAEVTLSTGCADGKQGMGDTEAGIALVFGAHVAIVEVRWSSRTAGAVCVASLASIARIAVGTVCADWRSNVDRPVNGMA
jgi:hypothetical protein